MKKPSPDEIIARSANQIVPPKFRESTKNVVLYLPDHLFGSMEGWRWVCVRDYNSRFCPTFLMERVFLAVTSGLIRSISVQFCNTHFLSLISVHIVVLYIQAHQRRLKYPLFTFLYPAWWGENWWVGDGIVDYGCTVEEREAVVNRSIAVLLYEYYETLDDVAETGTVSNLSYVITHA